MDRLGDFRLRKKLAVGGMGEVYLGEKVGPEGFVKPVVLKCVRPQIANDPGFVQLFLDEARLAALLNHPNIAQVYDFGFVDETYFIAMEYVPGYTVDDIRRKLGSEGQFMPLQHIANIASQACQGLHHAHTLTDGQGEGLGLVHRDVSPHNLIVSVDGTVKLVDFGIAKARAGLTRVRAKGAVGKFGYMSPEQSRDESVDGRSDVFSLGVCLWELTTNERLWPPKLERPPDYTSGTGLPGVDDRRPEVPRQFSSILSTALAVDRRERFASAREMHLALERFQAAMTHYAGQAALAQYIADLVEGRVAAGSSGFAALTDGLALPEAGGPATPTGAGASAGRRMPASWDEPKSRPTSGLTQRVGGTKEVEFDGDPGAVPELARPAAVPARPITAESSSRRTPLPSAPKRRSPVALGLAVLAAVAGLSWFFRAELAGGVGHVGRVLTPAPAVPVEGTPRCRIESTPIGGRVFIDGEELEHRTPLEVPLIPQVEHRIEVRLEGHATAVRRVTADLGDEPVRLDFALEPAGTLDIRSQPAGAKIRVDGRDLPDRTPVVADDVPAGRRLSVRAELPGREPAWREVVVPAGQRARVDFELSRQASTE